MQRKATPSEVSEPRQEQMMNLEGGFYQRDRSWHPAALTPQYKTSVLRSPQYPLLALDNTISEMTGPRFGHNKIGPLDNDLIRNFAKTGDAIGQRIIVYGRVLDENARPVPGALVEFWQANAGGRYRHKKETYLAARSGRGSRAFWKRRKPISPPSTRISAAADARSPMRKGATGSAPSSPAPTRGRTASTTGARRTSTSRSSAMPSPSA